MGQPSPWLFFLIVLLVAGSAFFSATETAYSSFNKIRMRGLASSGNKKAEKVLEIAEQYDKSLSAILIGNNIVNIASASVGTVIFTGMFGAAGVSLSTLVMTIVVLIFGEIMPKSYAKQHAESVSMRVAYILDFIMKLLTPIIFLFVKLQSIFKKKGESEPTVTEEELKYIIEEIEDEGVLEEQESELIQSAIEFDDITVDEILTPRVDVTTFDLEDGNQAMYELLIADNHSRIPVYRKDIDNIVGVIHEKDFFREYLKDPAFPIESIVKEPYLVPPGKKISQLLRELQRMKNHMAIVIDQYGGFEGIVTMEDIMEELVGEIWDESDIVTHFITKVSDSVYIINGEYNVYDMFEELELDADDLETDSNSVSGWVLENLGTIPAVGDGFTYENLKVTVIEIEEQRIKKVRLEIGSGSN